MAEDPINPLLGFFNALEQRKGAKGVVNDGKKVSATLTPEETARYTNIFKIMKDVVNPGPEAGTIAATPDSGTTPESAATDSASPSTTKKEDGFSLSSLMGLLPALGPALALLGPALAGAITAGIVAAAKDIDWGDTMTDFENWLSNKLFPQPSEEEINAQVLKERGENKEIKLARKKTNDLLTDMYNLARTQATDDELTVLEQLQSGPRSAKSQQELIALRRSIIGRTEEGQQLLEDVDKSQANLNKMAIDTATENLKQATKELEDRQNSEERSVPTSPFFDPSGSISWILSWFADEEFEKNKLEEIEQNEGNIAKSVRRRAEQIDRYIAEAMGAELYSQMTDRDNEWNKGLSDLAWSQKQQAFRSMYAAPLTRDWEKKYEQAKDADDIMVNSNGDVYNLDSQDSLVAAKPGGPIDKMLDQNSAIQSQQLNVLVAIREEVNAIRSSMSSNVSVAGNALTQEFYAQ